MCLAFRIVSYIPIRAHYLRYSPHSDVDDTTLVRRCRIRFPSLHCPAEAPYGGSIDPFALTRPAAESPSSRNEACRTGTRPAKRPGDVLRANWRKAEGTRHRAMGKQG